MKLAFIAILLTSTPAVGQTVTLPDHGGISLTTDGNGPLSAGYVNLKPGSHSLTPAGFTILSERIGSTLVSETGMPEVVPWTGQRIYAEVNGPITTGIVIANSSASGTVSVSFQLTDTNAVEVSSGTLSLAKGQQVAKFLTEPPFNSGDSFQGTVTVTSTDSVAVSGLRGYLNERNEFLWSTLPPAILPMFPQTPTPSLAAVFLPHFADGQGWSTQIVLVNPTDSTITGTIEFFGQAGVVPGYAISITANGQTATSFPYSIPPRSSFKLATSGIEPSGTVLAGSVRMLSPTTAVPSALAILSFRNSSGVMVSEAASSGVGGSGVRMYVEETTPVPAYPAIQAGFAVANLMGFPDSATLNLTGLDGSPIATATVPLPAQGQTAKMLHEVFPDLIYPFKGLLTIESTLLSATAFRLRYNERGEVLMTNTPAASEASENTTTMVFPQFMNGGGWTSQLVLFNAFQGVSGLPGISGPTTGQLTLTQSDGSPFTVTLK